MAVARLTRNGNSGLLLISTCVCDLVPLSLNSYLGPIVEYFVGPLGGYCHESASVVSSHDQQRGSRKSHRTYTAQPGLEPSASNQFCQTLCAVRHLSMLHVSGKWKLSRLQTKKDRFYNKLSLFALAVHRDSSTVVIPVLARRITLIALYLLFYFVRVKMQRRFSF